MDQIQRAYLLQSLCFFEALGYAPVLGEWVQNTPYSALSTQDEGKSKKESVQKVVGCIEELIAEGVVRCVRGRYGFSERVDDFVQMIEKRDRFQARKYRRARLVARWLSLFSGIRLVALANTTAWGYARDQSDIDFFIIVRKGCIWQARLWGVLPFKVLGWLPGPREKADAVCLSYFIADDGLDISSHQLQSSDPYFQHWFLALLPIMDDGIGALFWEANASIVSAFSFAKPWMVSEDLRVRPFRFRLPWFRWFEFLAEKIQRAWFPSSIRDLINVDTRVLVDEHVLKFHTDDAREEYRNKFKVICKQRGV